MKNRIPGLDGIRALSISLVLFAHVADGVTPWAKYGGFGVEIFFVLSGFLITWLLCVEEDRSGTIDLRAFYVRRALRILPPSVLCILGVAALGLVGLASVAPNELFYCLFFIRNMMPNGGPHLGHFWSLAIEEQFYFLWPLVFFLLRSDRRRIRYALCLAAAAPLWRYGAYKLADGAANVNSWRFDLRYDALLIGCCLALTRHSPQLRSFLTHRIARATPVALLAVAGIVAGLAGLPLRILSPSLTYVSVAVFINFAVERIDGPVAAFLNARPLVWIGQMSYSLYLWQQVFCKDSELLWLGRFPQNIVAAFLVAACSFYLIEAPIAKYRRKFAPRPAAESHMSKAVAGG